MALEGALVDQARKIEQRRGPKVDGRPTLTPTVGEWFRCRLTIPRADVSDDAAGYRRRVRTPTLLFGGKDVKGQPVVLAGNDTVEVRSYALGDERWTVEGVEVFRGRMDVVGYQATLRKVDPA